MRNDGRFAAYLHELRRELYLRFGRTMASWTVQQILAECKGHLEDAFRDIASSGVPEDDAAAEAVLRFGPPHVVAHAYRNVEVESDGTFRRSATTALHRAAPPGRPQRDRLETESMLSALVRDFRLALRGLGRAPGYTLAFVLTLGLGIGANTAIFSVVNGALLRPLPYEDGHELVYLRHAAPGIGMDNIAFSVPEIDDYRQSVASFESVAEFSVMSFNIVGLDEPVRVRAGIVTGNYFEVMGFGAALGRVIDPGDDGATVDPVMVLTHEYWLDQFGGDPDVIGKQYTVNNVVATLIGVAQPAPPYPEETDIYVNMRASDHHLEATMITDRTHRMTEVFARLAPSATLEQARGQIDGVTERLHAAYPEAYDPSLGITVTSELLRTQLAARARTTFLMLLGAAAFVLVIACANVANLTLARVARRRRELTVRASLGAGTGALRRQLLMENLVPALFGGALGIVFAVVGLDSLVRYAARYSARAGEISIDATVLIVTLAVSVAAAALFAMVPRLPTQAGRYADATSQARATAGITGRNLQRSLVVVQVAVCFVLLIGAGLFLRTLFNLNQANGGVELDSVLTLTIPEGFGTRTSAETTSFGERVLERIGALPGVQAAALGSRVPLRGLPEGVAAGLAAVEFRIESMPTESAAATPRADFRTVTPDYFDTLGMQLVSGRLFDSRDTADNNRVVMINQALARRYFPDRDPIGLTVEWSGDLVRFFPGAAGKRTIVGVVSDTNDFGITNPVPNVIFQPFTQMPDASVLFVRTDNPAAVAQAAASAIHAIDPAQPIINVETLAEVRANSIAPQRLNATLIGMFAGLAVVIAAVGVAGVLAFSVSQRTREMGVRAALGAGRARLLGVVLGEGMAMTAVGLLAGGVLAVVVSRLAAGMLFGVTPTDATTFVGVAIVLCGVAATAAWIPARRAAAVDPAIALKAD